MSKSSYFIFIAILLLSSFISAKNLSKKSSMKSYKSHSDDDYDEIDDSFDIDCVNVTFRDNRVIVECDDSSKELDLNQELGNDKGKLVIKKNGNFSRNCSSCQLNTEMVSGKKSFELSCTCLDNNRGNPSSITVDPVLKGMINWN